MNLGVNVGKKREVMRRMVLFNLYLYAMIYADTPIPHLRFELLERHADRVAHLVSTRLGGGGSCFTVGLNGLLPDAQVLEHRRGLADALGLRLVDMVFAQQVHGDRIAAVGPLQRGWGALTRSSAVPNADALTSSHTGIGLAALAADCVPMLMYDPVRHIAASVHSGWRGTAARIACKVVNRLAAQYGTNPAHLLVGIGPSIGPCCYHVGAEVVAQMRRALGDVDGLLGHGQAQPNPTLDLWEANLRLLLRAGVLPQHIEVAHLCTRCHSDLLFSARCADEGRFGAFITLK